ncbi:efflux RND transporter periplasmic adaptor subunit [Opitutaceae bacterium EW11]|nr:efflux RND transporter periplasmic adaptor subunit [Opitutaceae bacterium EW11]
MKSKTNRRLAILALLVLLAASFQIWRNLQLKTLYETSPVTRGDIEARVTALGVLQPRSYVDVGAQVSGVIQRLAVQPGSKVAKGDLLVEIDPSVQQATVDAGRAALAMLRAQLAEQKVQHRLATQQLERQRELAKCDATRAEDVQVAEAGAASAAARVESILAQIAQTEAAQRADEVRLGYTRIYAPMSGTVISVDAREGQTLNVTFQTASLLRIADLSSMTVWAEVSEADVRRVKPDLPAYFTTLGGDKRRWQGKVRQILPAPPGTGRTADDSAASAGAPKVVVYNALFDVDNRDGALMPRMTAQVSFVEASTSRALIIPVSALTPSDAQADGTQTSRKVRVLQSSGDAKDVAVNLGIQTRVQAEVLSGLKEGDLVITGEIDPTQPDKSKEFLP